MSVYVPDHQLFMKLHTSNVYMDNNIRLEGDGLHIDSLDQEADTKDFQLCIEAGTKYLCLYNKYTGTWRAFLLKTMPTSAEVSLVEPASYGFVKSDGGNHPLHLRLSRKRHEGEDPMSIDFVSQFITATGHEMYIHRAGETKVFVEHRPWEFRNRVAALVGQTMDIVSRPHSSYHDIEFSPEEVKVLAGFEFEQLMNLAKHFTELFTDLTNTRYTGQVKPAVQVRGNFLFQLQRNKLLVNALAKALFYVVGTWARGLIGVHNLQCCLLEGDVICIDYKNRIEG